MNRVDVRPEFDLRVKFGGAFGQDAVVDSRHDYCVCELSVSCTKIARVVASRTVALAEATQCVFQG